MPRRPEPVPEFASKARERAYWESHDSPPHVDWSRAERVRLPNLKPSTTATSMRLPIAPLERIKLAANRRDVSYHSLIKTLARREGQAASKA
jgi:hypothetical protein